MTTVTHFDQDGSHATWGGQWFALRSQLPLIEEGARTTWIHCARPGKWKGHPDGAFAFKDDHFKQIVDNFEHQSNPVPLTYEHPEGRLDDGIAAGWIHALKRRDDGLWALVELTDKARAHIESGEYRFCSVVVDLESCDRESGEECGARLLEIGLTNVPFIDGLTAIRLSQRVAATEPRTRRLGMNIKDAFKKATEELPEDASLEQVMKFLKGFMEQQEAAKGEDKDKGDMPKPEASEPASDATQASEPAPEDGRQLAEDDSQAMALLEALGEQLQMEPAAVLAALQEKMDEVAKVLSGGMDEGAQPTPASEERPAQTELGELHQKALSERLKSKDEEVKKLNQRVQELESRDIEREVDDAIAEGLFLDKDKERLVKLAQTDRGQWKEWRDAAKEQPAVPTKPMHRPKPGAGVSASEREDDGKDLDPKLIETYEKVYRQLGKAEEDVRKLAIRDARKFSDRSNHAKA